MLEMNTLSRRPGWCLVPAQDIGCKGEQEDLHPCFLPQSTFELHLIKDVVPALWEI